MKFTKILFGLFVLCLISCSKDEEITLDCIPINAQTGVIAFYPFNNGSLLDESSGSTDLTNPTAATPTTDRNGNANCAYLFDGRQPTEQFLTTTATTVLDGLDAFSVSLWYQPIDTTRDGGDFELLLSRGDGVSCPDRNGEWSVALYDCRRVVFGHNTSVWAKPVTGLFIECQDEINALTDRWHHVVAVKNNDTYQIYFNGALEETETGNAGCNNMQLAQDIGDLFIGKRFTGKIDDIIIYDEALTAAQVTLLYELEPCCE